MEPDTFSTPILRRRPADRALIRDRNEAEIFATILTQGPLARVEVAGRTGLSQATITKVVQRLSDLELVEEVEEVDRRVIGRRAKLLQIRHDQRYAVGIGIIPDESGGPGGELIGVITDLQANIVSKERRKLKSKKPEVLVNHVTALTEELLERDTRFREKVIGLGVQLGGHVDIAAGEIRFSANVDWREPVEFAAQLKKKTHLEVVIENDVNALAVHEQWFGGGWDSRWFALVWIGSGIGCGLVLNNQLLHGSTGGAGELGHVVVEPGGVRCRCGAYGCLETVAAIPAILRRIRDHKDYSNLTGIEEVVSLAQEGDPVVQEVLGKAGGAFGRGISMLLNLFNPRKIILSGPAVVKSKQRSGPVLFSDYFMSEMERSLTRHSFSTLYSDCEFQVKGYSDESGAQGAASTVLNAFIADPLP